MDNPAPSLSENEQPDSVRERVPGAEAVSVSAAADAAFAVPTRVWLVKEQRVKLKAQADALQSI